jgi:hypothetical protein
MSKEIKTTTKTAPKKSANKTELVTLKALSNLSGNYLLPYSKGQVFSIAKKQADELIENKDAEISTLKK